MKLLDEVIIRSYPKLYLEYLDRLAQKKGKASALLLQVIQKSKSANNEEDVVKMLERVQEKIRREMLKGIDERKHDIDEFGELDIFGTQGNQADTDALLQDKYNTRFNQGKVDEYKEMEAAQ